MDLRQRLRPTVEWLLRFGAYPEETLEQRAKRRLYLAIAWIATVMTIPTVFEDLAAGHVWVAVVNGFVAALYIPNLMALR